MVTLQCHILKIPRVSLTYPHLTPDDFLYLLFPPGHFLSNINYNPPILFFSSFFLSSSFLCCFLYSYKPPTDEPTSPGADLRARHVPASSVVSSGMSSAPAAVTSPASPTFTFPLTRLFSHDCSECFLLRLPLWFPSACSHRVSDTLRISANVQWKRITLCFFVLGVLNCNDSFNNDFNQ